MILKVVKYGNPVLRKKGARVEGITPEIKKLIDDMFETMYAYKGVGLAAQQVGQACGQNPIAIIIPCHRIVGTNWLGGFSSALGTYSKTFLLDLECGQQRLL